MKNVLIKVAASSATALSLSMAIPQQARAVSFNFSWQGEGGYSTKGMFSYDENTAPAIISESGAGPTGFLESLMVSFYDPANNPMQSFNTVAGGVSNSPYFLFNLDTTTLSLFGSLNIGGGTGVIGEQFFTGTIGGLLRLRQDIDQQGASFEIDRQDIGLVTVTALPESTSLLGSLALVGSCAALMVIRHQKAHSAHGLAF